MRDSLTIMVGIIGLVLLFGTTVSGSAPNDEYNYIETTLKQTGTSAVGAYFEGSSNHAIIMVPGDKYNKDSWYFLAKRLQAVGISSLAIDSGSVLTEAINFVQKKGYKQISAIGGSTGGESVIDAINSTAKNVFTKMVVLAPYDGKPIEDGKLQKLFVIGKKDFIVDYRDIDYLYKKSSDPKKIQVYKESSAHAQEFFETDLRDELVNLIIDFVSDN